MDTRLQAVRMIGTRRMEHELSVAQLRVPVYALPYFQAIWPERDALRRDGQDYIVPLKPRLYPPSERAWQWLKDALALLILTRRLYALPPYDPTADNESIDVVVPFEMLDQLGPDEVAALLALADFYDIDGILEPLVVQLRRIHRRIKPAPSDWTPTRTEEIVFAKEAAWRNRAYAWLLQRLHSLDMVARITKNWPRLGPLVACGLDHTLFLAQGQLWAAAGAWWARSASCR